jgi:hypothetical protein
MGQCLVSKGVAALLNSFLFRRKINYSAPNREPETENFLFLIHSQGAVSEGAAALLAHMHTLIHVHIHIYTHIHSHGAVFQGVAALRAHAHMSAGVKQMAVSTGIHKKKS